MLNAIQNAAIMCKIKVDAWFNRVFKEQAGGAEIIATLVIIAVVLVLAFAFRDNLSDLVKSLWNNMTQTGAEGAEASIPEWS